MRPRPLPALPKHAANLLEGLSLAAPPVVLAACAAAGVYQTALLSLAVVLAALLLFFGRYEASSPRLRDMMPVAVLAALAAAGRVLFAALPSFKPVTAIAVVAGAVFGRRSGFMVGALAALVSNFFFGQGPWTPWQMYAWGLAGYGAGLLAQAGLANRPAVVCAFGFAASLGFGFIMNCWTFLGFVHASLGVGLLAVCASSLPFDMVHGAATVAFLVPLYLPWRRKLARIALRYGLGEPAGTARTPRRDTALERDDPQMLEEDLEPDEDEHDAADDRGGLFEPRAELVAHHHAGERQHEGGRSDERDRGDDVDL